MRVDTFREILMASVNIVSIIYSSLLGFHPFGDWLNKSRGDDFKNLDSK